MAELRARTLLAAPIVAAVACASDPRGGYEVLVHPSRQVPQLERIELVLSEDLCAAPEVFAGDLPPRIVARWTSSRREPTEDPIGAVAAGDYGLFARGFSARCQVVAAGCSVAELEVDGEGELELALERIEGAACAPGQSCGAQGRCTGAALACDPSRIGRWSAAAELPTPPGRPGVAAFGGELVVLGGGTSGADARADVFVAPLDDLGRPGAWRSGTPLPEGRSDPRVLVAGDLLLVSGGVAYDSDGAASAASTLLVGTTGTDGELAWRPEPMASGLVQHGLVAALGSLYVIGGLASPAGAALATVSRATLDPEDGTLGTWETLSSRALPEPAVVVGAFVHHSRVYVLSPERTFVARVSEAGLGPWATLEQPLPLGVDAALAVLDRHVHLMGASRGGAASREVFAAELRDDGDLGPWQPVLGLPDAREGRRATSAGGSLLVVGGIEPGGSPAPTLVERCPIGP